MLINLILHSVLCKRIFTGTSALLCKCVQKHFLISTNSFDYSFNVTVILLLQITLYDEAYDQREQKRNIQQRSKPL